MRPAIRSPLLGPALLGALLATGPARAQQPPPPAPQPAGARPAPAAPPAAGPAAAPSPEAAAPAPESFDTRVRALEEQVVDLKERIHRSKARLLLLQDTALGGDLSSGARAVLVHRNEMSSLFVLESVTYALDGAPIFTRSQDADLAQREEFEVFNGRIVPGPHQLAVRLVYRGNGYGVFSYAEGYRFKVQYSCSFRAEPGRPATVRIVGYEKGGLTADLGERPAVECRVEAGAPARPAEPAPADRGASSAARPPPAQDAPAESRPAVAAPTP